MTTLSKDICALCAQSSNALYPSWKSAPDSSSLGFLACLACEGAASVAVGEGDRLEVDNVVTVVVTVVPMVPVVPVGSTSIDDSLVSISNSKPSSLIWQLLHKYVSFIIDIEGLPSEPRDSGLASFMTYK